MKKLALLLALTLTAGCGPTPEQTKERDAQVRESGYKAGLAGQSSQVNPHTPRSGFYTGRDHQMWSEGWLDGDSERRIKEKQCSEEIDRGR